MITGLVLGAIFGMVTGAIFGSKGWPTLLMLMVVMPMGFILEIVCQLLHLP